VDLQTHPVQQIEETIAFLKGHRIVPRHLQDSFAEGERLTAIPLLVLANKCDDEDCDEVFEIFCELLEGEWPLLPVSAASERNLDRLKRSVFEQLGIMRVFSKPPGEAPDLGEPYVVDIGSTVADLAAKVHRDFYDNLKTARVWGTGVFDGQMVGRDHILHDGDIVELRI
jgi:ribosome-interacting GTPase 1